MRAHFIDVKYNFVSREKDSFEGKLSAYDFLINNNKDLQSPIIIMYRYLLIMVVNVVYW